MLHGQADRWPSAFISWLLYVAVAGQNCYSAGDATASLLRLPKQLVSSGEPYLAQDLEHDMLQEGLLMNENRDQLAGLLRRMTRASTKRTFTGNMQSPYETFSDFAEVRLAFKPNSISYMTAVVAASTF